MISYDDYEIGFILVNITVIRVLGSRIVLKYFFDPLKLVF